MKFVSTNKKSEPVLFFEAMRAGLAPDGGLYMPETIPTLPKGFWQKTGDLSFHEIAFEMAKPFLDGELTDSDIQSVVEDAFQFPIEIRSLHEGIHVLELYHGPTLAFKDFGARFMARLFSEKVQKDQKEVTILVATSGDTGSAVAHGFYQVPGVQVCLLYPKGKVSRLQEQQMATLGENVTTLEVDGVFDDCQKLVKQAFVDPDLNKQMQLSSANSINIARLLPQSFYYAYAFGALRKEGRTSPVFSVPSGNFGNLTGGLLAMKMGMPVQHFLAATNVNDVVPEFLKGKDYTPKHSIQTISNAMDVGNPSNFERIRSLFKHSDEAIRHHLMGYAYTDDETRETIRQVYDLFDYLICPHTAIGYRAALEHKRENKQKNSYITLATAHPVKFRDVIEPQIGHQIPVPDRLEQWMDKEKTSIPLSKSYDTFKEFLLGNGSKEI
ncbi:MAG: threonine synthase [Balneolaceae bacterium]